MKLWKGRNIFFKDMREREERTDIEIARERFLAVLEELLNNNNKT